MPGLNESTDPEVSYPFHAQERLAMIRHGTFALVILAAVLSTSVNVQTHYRQPPADVVAILDAPPPPRAIENPTRDALLLVEMQPYPSIEVVARPVLRLAGLRINPIAGCSQRAMTFTGLMIQPLDNSPSRRIQLPPGASIQGPTWSHDGKRIGFTRDLDDGVELWVAEAVTGRAKPIAGVRLNDVLAGGIHWQSDNRHLLALLVPEGRGPAPAPTRAPAGPNVQVTSGRRSQMATFQDLLASERDEDLFQHFATSQLARIDTETGEVERVGPPALVTSFSLSPDEKYILVGTVRRPFSYRVPFVYFTRKTEVWTASGKPVATVADLPISGDIPRQGVPTGPRRVEWQPLYDARLIWSEALDGGDPPQRFLIAIR